MKSTDNKFWCSKAIP